jgi:hypothetical protein
MPDSIATGSFWCNPNQHPETCARQNAPLTPFFQIVGVYPTKTFSLPTSPYLHLPMVIESTIGSLKPTSVFVGNQFGSLTYE